MSGKVVTCVICGVRFDLRRAKKCDGHPSRNEMPDRSKAARMGIGPTKWKRREFCFKCPIGHALHDFSGWWVLPIREPTDEEARLGLDWVLAEVEK